MAHKNENDKMIRVKEKPELLRAAQAKRELVANTKPKKKQK